MRAQRGFTLIELIIVIVLLAIVAGFSFQFVGIGAQMFSTGSDRLQTLEKSRFAIERLTREIRGAVPNSVRVTEESNGQCIEFVPVVAAGTYYNAPILPELSNQMSFVTFDDEWEITGGERVFIYVTLPNFIYSNSGHYAEIQSREEIGNIEFELTLGDSSQFAKDSPLKRAYIGRERVSFCFSGGDLYRRENKWSGELLDSALIARGVSSTNFDVTAGNQSNNIVTIQLQFGENTEEQIFYYREVHIPNAP